MVAAIEGTLTVSEPTGSVSTLQLVPDDARALLVFAHGAGAGMRHAGMESLAYTGTMAEQVLTSLRGKGAFGHAAQAFQPDQAAVFDLSDDEAKLVHMGKDHDRRQVRIARQGADQIAQPV